jgi:hypothetical protein
MHPHQLTDLAAIREFTFAGNARLTLVSRKTGARFTYRIAKAKPLGDGVARYFVSVLNGPENTTDYTYLGFFRRSEYEHGNRSKIDCGAPCALAFSWFARKMWSAEILEQVEVWHEGRCGRCNRVLTVPESIARGIGPECAGML